MLPVSPRSFNFCHTQNFESEEEKNINYGRGTNKIHQYTVKQRPESMTTLPAVYERDTLSVGWRRDCMPRLLGKHNGRRAKW